MGMEKAHMLFRLRQRTVGPGERDHDFDAPPARSDKRSKRLRKACRTIPYGSRLRTVDQVAETEQHQSGIRGHADPFAIPFQRNAEQDNGNLLCCKAFRLGSQIRYVLPQHGYRLPAVFRFHAVENKA